MRLTLIIELLWIIPSYLLIWIPSLYLLYNLLNYHRYFL